MLFYSGSTALSYVSVGVITAPVLLDEVYCQGHESSIINCAYNETVVGISSYCNDYAGVHCVCKCKI